ncbi:MAG: xanthine dehydrogenase family protein molybdopterin-binding subunit, partial [Propionibacteriales bacterium]|nr:xanthine dehydrogenase family protein molybdopterin-binding subunit [Propionibacteriales bacterium]
MTAVEDRPATDAPRGEVGASRRRKEDQRLITGRTRWTDNMTLPGMLHLAMVRSPMAHATITSVDVEAARSAPGVVTVIAGSDLADEQGTLPNVWTITPEQKTPTHPSMAVDTVRFAGEIVACVVARSAAAARDAVELVDVDYDDLPVLLDTREALKDETVIHPEIGTNESAHLVMDFQTESSPGDVDAVIEAARADGIVFEREYEQQRLIPAFMEPRSMVCDPTGEQTVLWSATQIPHILRVLLALSLGISESKLRVIAPDVGGGFGGKLQVTPEEFITVLVARRIGKPCKYTETRSESLMVGHHGRA